MGWTPLSPIRPIAGSGQNLTLGSTSVQSNAIGAYTQMVLLSSTGNCHIAVGTNPVALATDMLIKETDPPIAIRIAGGEKIAVIQDGTSSGILNVAEVTH